MRFGSSKIYRALQFLTRHYPTVRGTGRISRGVGRILPRPPGTWVVLPPNPWLPQVNLDIGIESHRTLYLFPKVYGRLNVSQGLLSLLTDRLSNGGVFIDVGAHIGVYSLAAARQLGNRGIVHAFEPDPATFQALAKSVRLNGLENVVLVNAAVSDSSASALLFRDSPGSTMNSLTGHNQRDRQIQPDAVWVATTTLDHYCESGAVDPFQIRIIKIDVEGAEALAVSGMLATLKQSHAPVWCEVRGVSEPGRGEATFGIVSSLLTPLGYRAYRLSRGSEEMVTSVSRREDVLFRFSPG